ncbi:MULTISPECIES: hypothetical protein [unclassified Streptomyces]|nr:MULTISPECIES: hypothetical protein [unclassified Streptomyces]
MAGDAGPDRIEDAGAEGIDVFADDLPAAAGRVLVWLWCSHTR